MKEPTNHTNSTNPDAVMMEMEEFFFAQTAASFARRPDMSVERARDHIRESLRLHRFLVFGWLMQNGVGLPVELVSDVTHPIVGEQSADRQAGAQ